MSTFFPFALCILYFTSNFILKLWLHIFAGTMAFSQSFFPFFSVSWRVDCLLVKVHFSCFHEILAHYSQHFYLILEGFFAQFTTSQSIFLYFSQHLDFNETNLPPLIYLSPAWPSSWSIFNTFECVFLAKTDLSLELQTVLIVFYLELKPVKPSGWLCLWECASKCGLLSLKSASVRSFSLFLPYLFLNLIPLFDLTSACVFISTCMYKATWDYSLNNPTWVAPAVIFHLFNLKKRCLTAMRREPVCCTVDGLWL